MKTNKYKRLPYHTIEKAVHGDDDGINAVLEHYRGYIDKIARRKLFDKDGRPYVGVDKTLVDRLESKLMQKILNFRL